VYGSFTYWDGRTQQKLISDNYWPELIQAYRTNLERVAGVTNSPELWIESGGLLLMFTGCAMEYHSRGAAYWAAGLFLALTSLMIGGRRNARRQLQELDALLEANPLK
jgi:hypothetical protein